MMGMILFVLSALMIGCNPEDQIRKDAESVHKGYLENTKIVIKPIGFDSAETIKTDIVDMSDSIVFLLKRVGLDWKNPPTYSGSLFEGMVQKRFSCLESAVIFQYYNYKTDVDTVIAYGDAKAIEVVHSDPGWTLSRTISGNIVVDRISRTPKPH